MGDDTDPVDCTEHGKSHPAFVCEHLGEDPVQRWHGDYPSDDDPWPDAWCDRCNAAYLREGEWNDRNSANLKLCVVCSQCYEGARGASVGRLRGKALKSWNALLDRCRAELRAKQDRLKAQYLLGEHKRWDWDQERAEIVFSNDGVPAVIAQVEFVGTVARTSETWLWSWANPHLLQGVRGRMTEVRTFGEKHDYPHLIVPKWAAEEADGWDMAAIAAHVLGAQGVYRTPSESGFVFMTIRGMRFAQ